ncbi:S1C family serine protease [Pseudochelatococcus lubricantis]|uniref:S1C family serine protease n=1 Tax=Pseudochelatococcus lubricantis TaxID=1538102 RepID=UPI0035EC67A7
MRFGWRFIAVLWLWNIGVFAAGSSSAQSLLLPPADRWLVLASRLDLEEAIGAARPYAQRLSGVQVIKAANGRFAVVVGPLAAAKVQAIKDSLSSSIGAPSDAFATRGERFVEILWKAPPAPLLAFEKYDGEAPTVLRHQQLTLTLDAVPQRDGMKAARLTVQGGGVPTVQAVISEGASERVQSTVRVIRGGSGSQMPLIVFDYYWGGAHCCTVTQVLSFNGGRWQIARGQTLDGDGYAIEDVDGDGNVEFLSIDNSFLYAFDSYAGSSAPPRIERLVGTSLQDVTREPRYQRYLRQRLAWMERNASEEPSVWRGNGFLGGWVAVKAQVGEFDEAWTRMLQLYDPNSHFAQKVCTLNRPIDKCPDGAQRVVPFPETLKAHLIKNGYIGGTTDQSTASFEDARRSFEALPINLRLDIQMMMIATGHWPAVSNEQFGKRLFQAVQAFQSEIGAPQNGILTQPELAELRERAADVLRRWGLSSTILFQTNTPFWIPRGLGLNQRPISNGMAYEANDGSLEIVTSFHPSTALQPFFNTVVGSVQPPATVNFKVLRPTFFVVSFSEGDRSTYVRMASLNGEIVGFTISWNSSAFHGDRLSTLMSDLFRANVELGQHRAPPVPPTIAAMAPVAPIPSPVPAPTPAPRVPAPAPSIGQTFTGTGFYVSEEGQLVTNAHVVDSCVQTTVRYAQDPPREARIVARDKINDLALLATDKPAPAVAAFRPGVRMGEYAAVFGYPLTGLLTSGGNFTQGSVTALAGLKDDTRMLQISAPVQPGNSGGPLLDENGHVVGVVVAKLNALKVAAATEDLAQNVNFAIKASVVQGFLEAQGVKLKIGEPGVPALKPPDIADRAKLFSALVVCQH